MILAFIAYKLEEIKQETPEVVNEYTVWDLIGFLIVCFSFTYFIVLYFIHKEYYEEPGKWRKRFRKRKVNWKQKTRGGG